MFDTTTKFATFMTTTTTCTTTPHTMSSTSCMRTTPDDSKYDGCQSSVAAAAAAAAPIIGRSYQMISPILFYTQSSTRFCNDGTFEVKYDVVFKEQQQCHPQ